MAPDVIPEVKLLVCRGTSCSSFSSRELVRDLEDLCMDSCVDVTMRKCMGQCGSGPNVQIIRKGSSSTSSAIRSYRMIEELAVSNVPDLRIASTQRQIASLKYDARREKDAAVALKRLAAAFQLVEKDQNGARSQLLVARSRVHLGMQNLAAALSDASEAARLTPLWAPAHLACAYAADASGSSDKVFELLRTSLALKGGIHGERDAVGRWLANLRGETVDEDVELLEWRIAKKSAVSEDCLSISLRVEDAAKLAAVPDIEDTWHVDLFAELEVGSMQKDVVRAYTPTSSLDDYSRGHLELLVKIYDVGCMTQYINGLAENSKLLVSAPKPTLGLASYTGVIMIAGGSAATVALQVCSAVLQRHPRRGLVRLILCNKTTRDIWMRKDFDDLQRSYSNFKVTHCISNGPLPKPGNAGSAKWASGRISKEILSNFEFYLPVVISGPLGLCRAANKLLLELGWDKDSINVLDDADGPPTPLLQKALSPPASQCMPDDKTVLQREMAPEPEGGRSSPASTAKLSDVSVAHEASTESKGPASSGKVPNDYEDDGVVTPCCWAPWR